MDFGHHLIIDVETGEETLVPLTSEEIAQRQKILDSLPTDEQIKQEQIEREAKRTRAQAKLAELGLTAEDLKALGL